MSGKSHPRRSLAVLPARGGSKRVPGKALIEMEGRPMIGWPLEAARDSGLFAAIHVTTDSDSIADAVGALGYPVAFMRDPALADDVTPLRPVLSWVLRAFRERGEVFDDVALIYPTAVMLSPEDLRAGYTLFEQHGSRDPVLAVVRYAMPVERALQRDESGHLSAWMPDMLPRRTQDFVPKFHDTGTFAIFSADELLDNPDRAVDQRFLCYAMPRERGIDIDEPEDLALARLLLRGRLASASDDRDGPMPQRGRDGD